MPVLFFGLRSWSQAAWFLKFAEHISGAKYISETGSFAYLTHHEEWRWGAGFFSPAEMKGGKRSEVPLFKWLQRASGSWPEPGISHLSG